MQTMLSCLGAVADRSEIFSDVSLFTLITDISCTGNEYSILECSTNQMDEHSCGPNEDAGIICQSNYTKYSQLLFNHHFLFFQHMQSML